MSLIVLFEHCIFCDAEVHRTFGSRSWEFDRDYWTDFTCRECGEFFLVPKGEQHVWYVQTGFRTS